MNIQRLWLTIIILIFSTIHVVAAQTDPKPIEVQVKAPDGLMLVGDY